MLTVKVNLNDHSYDILVGYEISKDLGHLLNPLNLGKDAIIITHPIINKYHGKVLVSTLRRGGYTVKIFEVPEGEKSKSVRCAFHLIEKIATCDVKRKIFVIAFGGGVIGDLAGFVSAIYKRGIPYLQVPTTLLAQIDSAIGGKVGIDLSIGKNLVGTFYHPRLVSSDIEILLTLNQRQIRNGLAEAIKYGIICDRKLFDFIWNNTQKLLGKDPGVLQELVFICSQIKAKIVMSDEREKKGIRTILNFGHTTGHAIEAANQYKYYHHGEAVCLGMRVASLISHRLGLLSDTDMNRMAELLTRIGLPQRIKKGNLSTIIHHMQHDKKFIAQKNRFVLATEIGSVKVVEDVPPKIILESIRALM